MRFAGERRPDEGREEPDKTDERIDLVRTQQQGVSRVGDSLALAGTPKTLTPI